MKGPDQHHWSRNIVRRVEGWINQLLTCLIEPGVRGLNFAGSVTRTQTWSSSSKSAKRFCVRNCVKARRHDEVLKTALLPLTK